MTGEALNLERQTLRRLFPGLRLVGAIRMAFDLRKLVIAALGLALLQLGWSILDRLFPGSTAVTPLRSTAGLTIDLDSHPLPWKSEGLWQAHDRLSEPFRNLLSPLSALFDPRGGWLAILHALLAMSWLFLVWGICGGAICRIAVVRVARMQQTGIGAAISFARRKAVPLTLSPFILLGGLTFCSMILAGFGLLYWVPAVGSVLGGVLFAIPLGLGLIMTLLAVALAVGWPLLQAAVAAGAEDSLDALSRSFGYVNQRIGSLVALAGFAWLEGMIGIFLMNLLAAAVIRFTEWGLGLTGPSAQIATIFGRAGEGQSAVATAAHSFWLGVVNLLAHGWAYSFFWTAAALIYLWLRHDVDGTPWEDIDPPTVPPTGLITEVLPRASGGTEQGGAEGDR
jgi:hypothetical protein